MREIQIEMSDETIRYLWKLKREFKNPWGDYNISYDSYHKRQKEQKLGALFG